VPARYVHDPNILDLIGQYLRRTAGNGG